MQQQDLTILDTMKVPEMIALPLPSFQELYYGLVKTDSHSQTVLLCKIAASGHPGVT